MERKRARERVPFYKFRPKEVDERGGGPSDREMEEQPRRNDFPSFFLNLVSFIDALLDRAAAINLLVNARIMATLESMRMKGVKGKGNGRQPSRQFLLGIARGSVFTEDRGVGANERSETRSFGSGGWKRAAPGDELYRLASGGQQIAFSPRNLPAVPTILPKVTRG